jgi:hypothetical protein
MWNLRIDAATAEVLGALTDHGIDAVVLKGPALSDWYPDDSDRTYSDGDVWVAPGAVDEAEKTLSELDFSPTSDERGLPAWWLAHASNWQRDRDDVRIDLHRRLQGVERDPVSVWEELWPRCESFSVAGRPARRLPADARVLYATLHATHHGIANPAALAHLQAALAAADEATWRQAALLAERLDAVESFATGLRLVPAGIELATRLGVPDEVSVRSALHAASPPPVALGFDELARAHGVRRLHILLRKFVPPPGFIRHWWPRAAGSRRMLVVGYLYRPIWLLLRAPAGYRAWRAASRAAKSSS